MQEQSPGVLVTGCPILDDYLDEPLISCFVILTDWEHNTSHDVRFQSFAASVI